MPIKFENTWAEWKAQLKDGTEEAGCGWSEASTFLDRHQDIAWRTLSPPRCDVSDRNGEFNRKGNKVNKEKRPRVEVLLAEKWGHKNGM
jgi:hypothetical protein